MVDCLGTTLMVHIADFGDPATGFGKAIASSERGGV
jgi:hypothetical protein